MTVCQTPKLCAAEREDDEPTGDKGTGLLKPHYLTAGYFHKGGDHLGHPADPFLTRIKSPPPNPDIP